MRIVILSVGAPRDRFLVGAIRDYEERSRRYFALDAIEVSAAPARGRTPEQVRRREAEALRIRLPPELKSFALARDGIRFDSRDLARRLNELATYGLPGATFVVGGAYGLDPEFLAGCDVRLSLSDLTLPHEMARLVLAEQIYRAGTILRGEPYHKER